MSGGDGKIVRGTCLCVRQSVQLLHTDQADCKDRQTREPVSMDMGLERCIQKSGVWRLHQ